MTRRVARQLFSKAHNGSKGVNQATDNGSGADSTGWGEAALRKSTLPAMVAAAEFCRAAAEGDCAGSGRSGRLHGLRQLLPGGDDADQRTGRRAAGALSGDAAG